MNAQRGYVLIFALLTILLISLMAASAFTQSNEMAATLQTVAQHQIATANANRGMQEAIRVLRLGTDPVINLATLDGRICNPQLVDAVSGCPTGGYLQLRVPDGGGNIVDMGRFNDDAGFPQNPQQGAGLQFTYAVYQTSTNANAKNRVYNIDAIGYAGFSTTAGGISPNAVSAVLRVEFQAGGTSSGLDTGLVAESY